MFSKWPTVQQMLDMGKRVLIGTNDLDAGGVYVHKNYWREMGLDSFQQSKQYCGGFSDQEFSRVVRFSLSFSRSLSPSPSVSFVSFVVL